MALWLEHQFFTFFASAQCASMSPDDATSIAAERDWPIIILGHIGRGCLDRRALSTYFDERRCREQSGGALFGNYCSVPA